VYVIDAMDGTVKRELHHDGRFEAGMMSREYVKYAPDGERFVTWGVGDRVAVWRASGLAPHKSLDTGGYCSAADMSPDGELLVTPSWSGNAMVWRLDDGTPVVTLGHPDTVFNARFSADGKLVLSACRRLDGEGS
jgi:WD40 repeat protein